MGPLQIPLSIYELNENTGEFEWREPSLRFFADIIDLKIGNNAEEFAGKTKEMKLRHLNFLLTAWPLRWNSLEPKQGEISSDRVRHAKEIINTALANDMETMGQPLFFWAEYPDWLKEGNFSQQELEDIMREHVRTTMEPWKGIIKWLLAVSCG